MGESERQLVLAGTILLAIILGLIFFTGWNSEGSPTHYEEFNSSSIEELAKCLTSKGVHVYGASHCGACQRQQQKFGEAFKYINYTDCDFEQAKCSAAGIAWTPTWFIYRKKYEGAHELSELKAISGC